MLEALRVGCRLIDTAAACGHEEALGRAIRRSGVPRIAEPFQVFDFALSAGDMEAISRLDCGKRAFLDHRDPKVVKWPGKARSGI